MDAPSRWGMMRQLIPKPRRSTHLHGRERELESVMALLRRGSARCVTITGPIGIGKTRFVDELRRKLRGERLRLRFVDGPITGSDDDVQVVAGPALLGLPGEREIVLGGLDFPAGADAGDAIALRRSPAVALLADAAGLDLETLDERALTALGRVAAASEGHPAVLEQLAGWLWVLAPLEVATAIEEGSLDLLSPDLTKRLRAGLAELDPDAREVLASLAETTGPFDLDAARAAVRAQRQRGLPRVLAELVTSGWLLRAGSKEAPRWRVLAPFRSLLRAEAPGAARLRLTAHYANRTRPVLERVVPSQSTAELFEARDEIIASWEDAHARRDPDEIPLAVALASISWNGDRDVARHVERIRATLRAHPRAPRRARLEFACGDALWISGALEEADASYTRAITRARRDRDVSLEAVGWIRRASLAPETGRLDLAEKQIATATELAQRCADPRVLAFATSTRGLLRRAAGDVAGALATFEEEVELAHAIGDPLYIARSEAAAADCHLVLGEYALGRMRYERAFQIARRIYPGWARILEGEMGLAAWEVGALAEAVSRCRRAIGGSLPPRYRVVFAAAIAGARAELGEHARAATALVRAEAMATGDATSQPALRAAALLVALAGAADERSRRAARSRITTYIAKRGPAVADFDRAFVRALERVAQSAARPAPLVPEGALDGRPRLEKVLAALRDAGGEPVSSSTLFAAVWPNERLDAAKADARVRKSISLLRDLGLRGAIVKSDDGYALRSEPT